MNWTKEFRLAAREMGIWDSVRRELRDLERRLRDPRERDRVLSMLESQPEVGYITFKGRIYRVRRMYFGRGTARAGFVIRRDICRRVWFVALRPRSNGTYRRRRWA